MSETASNPAYQGSKPKEYTAVCTLQKKDHLTCAVLLVGIIAIQEQMWNHGPKKKPMRDQIAKVPILKKDQRNLSILKPRSIGIRR